MQAKRLASLFAVCCLINVLSLPANAQQSTQKQKLSNIKQQIQKQKASLDETNQQQKEIENRLKKDELAIAASAAEMNKTKQQKRDVEQTLKTLSAKQAKLKKQKKQQENALAEQIRTAYTNGQHDYLKLLLNQEEPGKVQRSLTYYQYLNDARVDSIESFEQVIKQLQEVELEQQKQQANLEQLISKQQQQKNQLEDQRQQRKQTLKKLNSQILSSKQRLQKLESEEKSLIQTLARIQAKARQQKTLVGLKKLKKQLFWPVKGRIKRSFGSKKQGYLRWKGVLLSARLGDDVKSIHNGTVLFADWLKGYGLVIVLDHGDGYMSLYGHNQALLKNVGDHVEIGEPIALAGQSGGQSQTGLYFEIRHKGKPVNPKIWCR